MHLFQAFDVWERVSENQAIRYRCLKRLADEGFVVQSADFFYRPIDKESLLASDLQLVELLLDSDPFDRAEAANTLEKAIQLHKSAFLDVNES